MSWPEEEIKGCINCLLRNNIQTGCTPVVGLGNLKATTLIVTDIVGADGPLLDKTLYGVELIHLKKLLRLSNIPEHTTYLTSLVKCNNGIIRAISRKSIKSCSSWLKQQIDYIKPKNIVSFGKHSETYLTKEIKGYKQLNLPAIHRIIHGSLQQEKDIIEQLKELGENNV